MGGRIVRTRRRRQRRQGRAGWAALVLGLLLAPAPAAGADDCGFDAGPAVVFERVIDAETLALADGGEVRLINVLTPEGAAADAVAALEALLDGRRLDLRFSGTRRDRRGRWLAHAFATHGAETVWVQAHLVGRGLARVQSLAGTRACVRRLQALEAGARSGRLGFWRRPGEAPVPAERTSLLRRGVNEFRIVEGRVLGVGTTRDWTFLNFGDDWRRDFTVAIAAQDRRLFAGTDADPDRLEGARVRVRGWIEIWNGPAIKATHPEQIEVLTDAAVAGGG